MPNEVFTVFIVENAAQIRRGGQRRKVDGIVGVAVANIYIEGSLVKETLAMPPQETNSSSCYACAVEGGA